MSLTLASSAPLYITNTGIGKFAFENTALSESLNIYTIRAWTDWRDCSYCKICLSGPFQRTFEVSLQWGDTKKIEYISTICHDCMHHIKESIAVKGTPLKKRRQSIS